MHLIMLQIGIVILLILWCFAFLSIHIRIIKGNRRIMDIRRSHNRIVRNAGQINSSRYASTRLKVGSKITGKRCIPIQAPKKEVSRCTNLGYCIPCCFPVIIYIVVIAGLSIFIICFFIYLTFIVPGIAFVLINQYGFCCRLICQTDGYDRRRISIIFCLTCDIIKIISTLGKRNCYGIFLDIQSASQNLDISSAFYRIIIRSCRCNQQRRWGICTCSSGKLICCSIF